MLIIISGFAGSGKSTLADSLGKEFGLEVIHASAILRDMSTGGVEALEAAVHEKINDWWESKEAEKFMHKRMKDGSLDRALDKKLIEIADKGNVILDSWTMPYLYDGGFKVWLDVGAKERAKRVAERDNLDYAGVLEKVMDRDAETKSLYERLYNFKMGENLEKFNLVIHSDDLSEKEVFEKVLKKVKGD
ncbi:cytidylate kinase family protein [archaeon]|nr:cytidylate kinase family protein [archaeon]